MDGGELRTAVVEFESYEMALRARESEAYQKALHAPGSGAERDFRIVEGAELSTVMGARDWTLLVTHVTCGAEPRCSFGRARSCTPCVRPQEGPLCVVRLRAPRRSCALGMVDSREFKANGPEHDVFWRDAKGVAQGTFKDVGTVPAPRPRDGLVWLRELQRRITGSALRRTK